MRRRLIIVIILIFSIFSFWFLFKEFTTAKQFDGNLLKVDDGFVVVRGTFVDSKQISLSKDLTDLKIYIDGETMIKRVAIKIPNTTEMFVIDSLPKEETVVDLETMKNDFLNNTIGLTARIKKTYFNKKSFIACFLMVFVFMLWTHQSFASTNSNSLNTICDRKDTSTSNVPCAYTVFSGDYQAWKATYSAYLEGHGAFGGSGGRGGMTLCLSSSAGAWTGSCQTVVNSNGEGNVGDGGRNFNGSIDIKDDRTVPYGWLNIFMYANDATWNPLGFTVEGRKADVS